VAKGHLFLTQEIQIINIEGIEKQIRTTKSSPKELWPTKSTREILIDKI
jgi:hypothetical protein